MPEPIRVLLDEGIPHQLRGAFSPAFTVETTQYRGWAGLKNGQLLRAAAPFFDALVTVDKGVRHQQNMTEHGIALVVLRASGTTFADLLPLLPAAESALLRAVPGSVTVISG